MDKYELDKLFSFFSIVIWATTTCVSTIIKTMNGWRREKERKSCEKLDQSFHIFCNKFKNKKKILFFSLCVDVFALFSNNQKFKNTFRK